MEIYHKKCKKRLFLDISGAILVYSPAFCLYEGGILPSVLEFESSGGSIRYLCKNCNEVITSENAGESVLVECSICGEKTDLKGARGSRHFSVICVTCQKELKNPNSDISHIKTVLEYYPKNSYRDLEINIIDVIFTLQTG